MSKTLKIGTRDSRLALWQAEQVLRALQRQGVSAELVAVKSPGDIDLTTPLHQFGSTGIFTKVLDEALLRNEIDIAVHSLKDYPTEAPAGLTIAAVLERGPHEDILVYKGNPAFLENTSSTATIATGSIRRAAQWKNRYPYHHTVGLRGNVQTRLKKLAESDWQGAIFAKAGLERIEILPGDHIALDWMIPAPAQGIIGIGCLSANAEVGGLLQKINHSPTFVKARVERQFLKTLEGGCSAPIGALATISGDHLHFKGGVFHPEGSDKAILEQTIPLTEIYNFGTIAAHKVLAIGGNEIMNTIRNA